MRAVAEVRLVYRRVFARPAVTLGARFGAARCLANRGVGRSHPLTRDSRGGIPIATVRDQRLRERHGHAHTEQRRQETAQCWSVASSAKEVQHAGEEVSHRCFRSLRAEPRPQLRERHGTDKLGYN